MLYWRNLLLLVFVLSLLVLLFFFFFFFFFFLLFFFLLLILGLLLSSSSWFSVFFWSWLCCCFLFFVFLLFLFFATLDLICEISDFHCPILCFGPCSSAFWRRIQIWWATNCHIHVENHHRNSTLRSVLKTNMIVGLGIFCSLYSSKAP